MNYKQTYIIEPKKFQPVCYFDSKETSFPIQINFFVNDMIELENKKQNKEKLTICQKIKNLLNSTNEEDFTIIPNFINYYTRVISHTFNPTTNENYQLNNYTVYYYYFMLYKYNIKTQLKCIVVETINNHLNRVLFTPNENSNQYFWYKYYNTTNSVIIHNSYQRHNCYPISGKIYRCFGFKNDTCDSKIFKKFSLSKLTDNSINSKLFDPFRELLTGNLNDYPIYNEELIQYNHLMKF